MAKTLTTDPEPTAPPAVFPSVDILERRLKTGDSDLQKVLTVTLVNQPEPMSLYEANCEIDGRFHEVTAQLGWVPVRPSEVAGSLPQGVWRADGDRVVAGDKGLIVLVKMPTRYRTAIRRQRDERLDRSMRSKSAMTSRVMQSAERDAQGADRATAESLERGAEAFAKSTHGSIEIDTFNVSRESVDLPRR